AMAYTFLKAEGFTVGKSLVEDSMLQTALEIKKRAEEKGIVFLLPTDHQVVDSYEPIKGQNIVTKTIPIEFTNIGLVGMDIGIETVAHFSAALRHARRRGRSHHAHFDRRRRHPRVSRRRRIAGRRCTQRQSITTLTLFGRLLCKSGNT